jgi:hypothetical protein
MDGFVKPSRIPDGFVQTVQKFIYRRYILDGFKPSIKNRLELIPDGFFCISGRFKTVQNLLFFFVVQPGMLIDLFYGNRILISYL